MNNYGPMKDTLRRVAAYQQAEFTYRPDLGEHLYEVRVFDGTKAISDVFPIRHDGELNAALNQLTLAAVA